MKKLLLLAVLFASGAIAQNIVSPTLIYVAATPTGACANGYAAVTRSTGVFTVCNNGTWGSPSFDGPVTIGTTVLPLGWYDVRKYGALCDGATSDTAAFAAAITAAPSGGTVYVPAGTCVATVSITKPLTLRGVGPASIIQGSGAAIVTVSLPSNSMGVYIEDLKISDPTGNASTVGLDLVGPATFPPNPFGDIWLRNLQILAPYAQTLGVGIRARNVITGKLDALIVGGWNIGFQALVHSNALTISGGDYTHNYVGMDYSATTSADSVMITGATIQENKTYQIIAQGVDNFALVGNHIEKGTPSGGDPATRYGVKSTGGPMFSSGNIYCCGTSDTGSDLIVEGNSGNVISIGDMFSNGVTNSAFAFRTLYIINEATIPITGNGRVIQVQGGGITQTNFAQAYILTNFTNFQSPPIGIGRVPISGHPLDMTAGEAITTSTSSTGTNRAGHQWINTGGSMTVGAESSTGGNWFTGSWPYSNVFGTTSNYPLHFFSNAIKRFTIANDGEAALTGTTGTANATAGTENLALYSADLSNAAWTTAGSGTGTAPTVTAAFAAAPDGTTTATRVQLNKGAGSTLSDYSLIQQGISTNLLNPHIHVLSVWLRSNTGSTYTVSLRDGDSGQRTNLSVTPTWQRFQYAVPSQASTASNPQLILRGTYSTDNSADILVWGFQVNRGSVATQYTPTTSAAVLGVGVVQATSFVAAGGQAVGVTGSTCTHWTGGICDKL